MRTHRALISSTMDGLECFLSLVRRRGGFWLLWSELTMLIVSHDCQSGGFSAPSLSMHRRWTCIMPPHGAPSPQTQETYDSSRPDHGWLPLVHDTECAFSIHPPSYSVSRDLENNEALGW